MQRCATLLFLLLANTLYGGIISDHTSTLWRGRPWIPNALETPHLLAQAAFFPLVCHGQGNIQLPDGAFLLRFHLFIKTNTPNQVLFRFMGRVAEDKVIALSELMVTNRQLVIRCYANPLKDSLFDSPTDVVLTSPCKANLWNSRELLINPLPYQQTIGWNEINAQPFDPTLPKKANSPTRLARQPTKARWYLKEIQIPTLDNAWFGGFELEFDINKTVLQQFNILRAP